MGGIFHPSPSQEDSGVIGGDAILSLLPLQPPLVFGALAPCLEVSSIGIQLRPEHPGWLQRINLARRIILPINTRIDHRVPRMKGLAKTLGYLRVPGAHIHLFRGIVTQMIEMKVSAGHILRVEFEFVVDPCAPDPAPEPNRLTTRTQLFPKERA